MTASSTGRHVDDTDNACLYPTTHLLQYLTMFSSSSSSSPYFVGQITQPFIKLASWKENLSKTSLLRRRVVSAFPGMVIASKNGALSSRVLRSWGLHRMVFPRPFLESQGKKWLVRMVERRWLFVEFEGVLNVLRGVSFPSVLGANVDARNSRDPLRYAVFIGVRSISTGAGDLVSTVRELSQVIPDRVFPPFVHR